MAEALTIQTGDAVRTITLARAEEYNTITPQLARDLEQALDAADEDPLVRVVLLRAEGKAFCAGYRLDWSTEHQAAMKTSEQAWDSITDYQQMMGFVRVYQKLWYLSKPTIAAVQGWCICGGTDLVLWADLIVAADDAVFGYPTSRLWGVPTTAMWVYRVGFENAKRYLLTGDEIPAPRAAQIGLIHETVPAEKLDEHALALARRMARLPLNQLQMIKLYCNQMAENMGLASARTLGVLFDGVARHTREGDEFVASAQKVGFREAVRRRDSPFGDYGSGPRSKRHEPENLT